MHSSPTTHSQQLFAQIKLNYYIPHGDVKKHHESTYTKKKKNLIIVMCIKTGNVLKTFPFWRDCDRWPLTVDRCSERRARSKNSASHPGAILFTVRNIKNTSNDDDDAAPLELIRTKSQLFKIQRDGIHPIIRPPIESNNKCLRVCVGDVRVYFPRLV